MTRRELIIMSPILLIQYILIFLIVGLFWLLSKLLKLGGENE